METERKLSFTIHPALLEKFAKEQRIVLKPAPGLWPVDARLLKQLDKLLADKEFNANFEIMIVPK